MSPFLINVQPCLLTGQAGESVSAEDLAQAASIRSLKVSVRNNCASMLRKVRQQMHQVRHEADSIRLEARQEAENLLESWQQEAKEEALTQSLSWHCREVEWTQTLMDTMHTRISETISEVLSAWTMEQDLSQLVIKRLTDKVCDRVGQGTVTLSVSADDYEAIADQLDSRMPVDVSEDLSQGQAELSSATLTAKINLAEDLERLLATFISSPPRDSIIT